MKRSIAQGQDTQFDEFDDEPRPKLRTAPGEIVHADDNLVIVAKSSGIWAEPGMEDEPGVAPLLIEAGHFTDENLVVPVFPVEPAVSGLVIYAKTQEAEKSLLKQANDNKFELNCTALVRGHVLENQGSLSFDVPQRVKTGAVQTLLSGLTAPPTTHWTLRDSFIGFAVLECRPHPPLPTLVRSHLESAGIPLAVDSLYGGAQELKLSSFKAGYRPSRRREERPLISRVSLHVASVSFEDPASGSPMHFEAPLPKDMRATLHQLDRFGRIGK